jgi:hypothetical protein
LVVGLRAAEDADHAAAPPLAALIVVGLALGEMRLDAAMALANGEADADDAAVIEGPL